MKSVLSMWSITVKKFTKVSYIYKVIKSYINKNETLVDLKRREKTNIFVNVLTDPRLSSVMSTSVPV